MQIGLGAGGRRNFQKIFYHKIEEKKEKKIDFDTFYMITHCVNKTINKSMNK
jgi:hypothetical protein